MLETLKGWAQIGLIQVLAWFGAVYFQIVASVRSFVENSINIGGYSHLIAPVLAGFFEWFVLADNSPRVILQRIVKIGLV